jgi:hypothetical protein
MTAAGHHRLRGRRIVIHCRQPTCQDYQNQHPERSSTPHSRMIVSHRFAFPELSLNRANLRVVAVARSIPCAKIMLGNGLGDRK